MATKQKITVALTGMNNVDSPGPGIPVARALLDCSKYDVKIIGLSYDALEPGIYMRNIVHKSYQIPMPSAGIHSLMTRLKYINSVENIDVIIPNFDAELYNFIKAQDRIKEELGIHTFLPSLEGFEERHKAVLNEFAIKYDIKVPKSKVIYKSSEIYTSLNEFGFPLVIKGKYYDASIAYNLEQAVSYFNKISAKWGLPIIIQQFTFGTEVNVTCIGDGNGKCIGAVPMRKMFITDKGKAWAGISIEDEELLHAAQKLISNSKWRGPCELEMIKTSEGEYYLIELNPRFPAWMYLAVGVGQNHAEALLDMIYDKKIKPFKEYEIGKMFIRYSYDMICELKDFEKISTLGEL